MDNKRELEMLYQFQKFLKCRLAEIEDEPQTCDACKARSAMEESLANVDRQILCARNDVEPSFGEYQADAARTMEASWTREEKITHALRGLAAEVGELNGIFQKEMQGHDVYEADVKEEIGDVMWFLNELATAMGMDMAAVARRNMTKRLVRYPNGFSEEDSINRRDHV